MWLNEVWFVLYVAIIAGYVILDGFDLGTGILHPFLARDDRERRVLLNAIGPVWDGNEVWLVLGVGALFAAFPMVYASLLSGFYLAMMLLLAVLILRAVAIEFRSKRPGDRWRTAWDWVFFGTSMGITLLLGVALANVIRGVPVDSDGNISMSLGALLSPYALAVGVTAVAMVVLHGAVFLTLKTDGDLLERLRRLVPRLMLVFVVLAAAVAVWTASLEVGFVDNIRSRPWTLVFPAGALVAAAVGWVLVRRGQYLPAFFASATVIGALLGSVAAGMYPVMLPSSIDPAYDLTIDNAASAPETLGVMLVMAGIGMPFVLLYTAGVYYFFRGRVVLEDESY